MKQIFEIIRKFNASQFFVAFLVITIIAGGGFFAGFVQGKKVPDTIFVKGLANIGDPDTTADFAIFWEAWQRLKEMHIDGDKVSDQDFVYGAIKGLAGSFGDPNTNFFPPVDAQKFKEDLKGEFAGIGAEIGLKDEQLIVIAPLADSPAERAGLKASDRILKIDDFNTVGVTVDEAVKRIRGAIGTTVVLQVLSENSTKRHDVSIMRDKIVIPTLSATLRDDHIWYVQLFNFNENASVQFQREAVNALRQGVAGVILDLRNNPGGFLEISINLAGWFLEQGEIVVTEDFKTEQDREFKSRGNGIFKDTPVVILMNKGSASASEILAGALRAQRGIQLIGEQSFGKGTVQQLEGLSDGSNVKITVARWLLPGGSAIDKEGLTPDIEVEFTEEDIEARRDVQFEKALEVLQKLIQEKSNN